MTVHDVRSDEVASTLPAFTPPTSHAVCQRIDRFGRAFVIRLVGNLRKRAQE